MAETRSSFSVLINSKDKGNGGFSGEVFERLTGTLQDLDETNKILSKGSVELTKLIQSRIRTPKDEDNKSSEFGGIEGIYKIASKFNVLDKALSTTASYFNALNKMSGVGQQGMTSAYSSLVTQQNSAIASLSGEAIGTAMGAAVGSLIPGFTMLGSLAGGKIGETIGSIVGNSFNAAEQYDIQNSSASRILLNTQAGVSGINTPGMSQKEGNYQITPAAEMARKMGMYPLVSDSYGVYKGESGRINMDAATVLKTAFLGYSTGVDQQAMPGFTKSLSNVFALGGLKTPEQQTNYMSDLAQSSKQYGGDTVTTLKRIENIMANTGMSATGAMQQVMSLQKFGDRAENATVGFNNEALVQQFAQKNIAKSMGFDLGAALNHNPQALSAFHKKFGNKLDANNPLQMAGEAAFGSDVFRSLMIDVPGMKTPKVPLTDLAKKMKGGIGELYQGLSPPEQKALQAQQKMYNDAIHTASIVATTVNVYGKVMNALDNPVSTLEGMASSALNTGKGIFNTVKNYTEGINPDDYIKNTAANRAEINATIQSNAALPQSYPLGAGQSQIVPAISGDSLHSDLLNHRHTS
jgi:hypothetical protein